MSHAVRVYVPSEPLGAPAPGRSRLVIAVIIPADDPAEALVVESFESGSVNSHWGELDMSERLYLKGGYKRADDTPVPPDMQAVIDRRYPEHLAWHDDRPPTFSG